METVLRSTITSKDKNSLSPVFSVADELIGLKLPSLRAKDKISTKAAQNEPGVFGKFLSPLVKLEVTPGSIVTSE
jgi:hypothetical protein